MKRVFYFLMAALMLISMGCSKSTKDNLIGSWQMKSVEGKKLTPEELKIVITMTEDGKFTMKSGEGDQRTGTWLLSEDDKKIDATSAEGDKEAWNIVSVDEKTFVFTVDDDKDKITLEKK
jgi:hypothetical protein